MVETKVQVSTEPTVDKKIVCLNDMNRYESIKDAAEAYNLGENAVSSVCAGYMTHVYGLKFVYEDEIGDCNGKDLRSELWRSHNTKKVICLTDGNVFTSVTEAAAAYGVHKSLVSLVCRDERPHAKGFKFVFEDHPEASSKAYLGMRLGRLKEEKKKVICVTDGNIFDSVSDAAKHYDMHRGNVSAVCTGKRRQARGLVFKFYEEETQNNSTVMAEQGSERKQHAV